MNYVNVFQRVYHSIPHFQTNPGDADANFPGHSLKDSKSCAGADDPQSLCYRVSKNRRALPLSGPGVGFETSLTLHPRAALDTRIFLVEIMLLLKYGSFFWPGTNVYPR